MQRAADWRARGFELFGSAVADRWAVIATPHRRKDGSVLGQPAHALAIQEMDGYEPSDTSPSVLASGMASVEASKHARDDVSNKTRRTPGRNLPRRIRRSNHARAVAARRRIWKEGARVIPGFCDAYRRSRRLVVTPILRVNPTVSDLIIWHFCHNFQLKNYSSIQYAPSIKQ
jgi:hypothetical protein